ncbi:MgtC/SapB family protein [Pseudonocardia acidicola]|uniref:MgtC/SapB family protein n=1 Tax=Pseudonocardia acidicola TaxID=2724939 RepID=A0ABX1S8G8_9PSEU|nr:MgtC/SapB family protein [Pseudonocardia acidicola]NMH96559.1 MgtC/SapB family protein [Pseudonocardia acidicola]
MALELGEPIGQGWSQIVELGIALVLSALIGLERELRQKSAGLRTHTIIGFSAALIMLVSKYGFTDVLGNHVVLDPSRVAAQIVSGIGFIGGGLIFVRRDAVRGLTTAAAVWLTTAVGMAAGAGLPVLALAAVAGYFVVIYGFTPLSARLRETRPRSQRIQVVYEDGRGILRQILNTCTARGWVVAELSTRQQAWELSAAQVGHPSARDHRLDEESGGARPVSVGIGLYGPADCDHLVAELARLDGVLTVTLGRPEEEVDPETE